MKRGSKPPLGLAFLWTFGSGYMLALGISQPSAVEIAVAVGWGVIGPIAWFVGRP